MKTKISKTEIQTGIKMESEHTKNKKKANKIAMEHLKEFPKYYNKKTGLPAMEKRLKKTK